MVVSNEVKESRHMYINNLFRTMQGDVLEVSLYLFVSCPQRRQELDTLQDDVLTLRTR